MIISFALTVLLGFFLVPFFRKTHVSQTERMEGPASHKEKSGTPVMGGIMFLLPWILVTAWTLPLHRNEAPILIATLGFAAIGFLDDFIKVKRMQNEGLRAWQKLLLQVVVSLAVIFYIRRFTNVSFDMRIPFSSLVTNGGTPVMVTAGIFAIPVELLVLCGTANGSNFTDGLDGLLSCVTICIAGFLAAASVRVMAGITPSAGAMIGALLGFLVYNHHPAKIFMGDTGSLSLGGYVAASAIMMNMPIYIVIVAFIYLAEVCSVIIQVSYFQATKGKRFFLMAPIHHHFELRGWTEVRVVAVFTMVTFILCLLGFAAL